jgi:hypothetical protein
VAFLGGRFGGAGRSYMAGQFVDNRVSFTMALAKTLIRAMLFSFAGLHICFSEHSRAPRWKLRMPGVTCFRENEAPHGFAFFSFTVWGHPGFGTLGTQFASQAHHRLLHNSLMYVKTPTPCQIGRSNTSILTYMYPQ